MFNDLRADPELRKHFQFWFYLYPTSEPYFVTAADLRRTLEISTVSLCTAALWDRGHMDWNAKIPTSTGEGSTCRPPNWSGRWLAFQSSWKTKTKECTGRSRSSSVLP